MSSGIYSASDVCQNRMSQMLENIEGAANSRDDTFIRGETLEELQNKAIEVFDYIRK